MVETSGEVDFHAVGEMSAMIEGKTEHGVARLDERLVDGCIGLCAGVRLHVDVFGTKQALATLTGNGFDLVNLLAATIVAASRIAFGILVGQHGTLSLKHGTRHEVFGGDHLQAVLLSRQLSVEYLGDFGVCFGDRRVEHVVRSLLSLAWRINTLPVRTCRLNDEVYVHKSHEGIGRFETWKQLRNKQETITTHKHASSHSTDAKHASSRP